MSISHDSVPECDHEQIQTEEIERIYNRWKDELSEESRHCAIPNAIAHLINLEARRAVLSGEVTNRANDVISYMFDITNGLVQSLFPEVEFVIRKSADLQHPHPPREYM